MERNDSSVLLQELDFTYVLDSSKWKCSSGPMDSKLNVQLSGWRLFNGWRDVGLLSSSNIVNFLFSLGTKTIWPSWKNANRTTINPIIRGHRTQGLTHLLGRQDRHVWLIVMQLPMKAGWRDAPLALQDLAVSNFQ